MARAVAKAAQTAPEVYDYGEEAGVGFEGTTGADLSIPFLSILQSNSPQVEEEEPKGAKPGLIYNTVTRELSTRVVFLPCHKDKAYVEWIPRDNGGGFVGLHDPNSREVTDAISDNNGVRFGKLSIGDNDLIETNYMYGLVLDDEGNTPQGFAVISFTSTKIKAFNDFNTAMFTLRGRPPIYSNRGVVRTVKQKNQHGTFYNFQVDPLKETWAESQINPKTEAHLLDEAKAFREMVLSGLARAAFETERSTGDGGGESGDGEDAPF